MFIVKKFYKIYNIQIPTKNLVGIFLFTSMNIAIIGLGLIGGSMALALKEKQLAANIIGVDANEAHCAQAIELGLVTTIMSEDEAIKNSDFIIVAVPVDVTASLLPTLLSKLTNQVLMDVGSCKKIICDAVANHPNRKQFVATHPMWGTEYSGPKAATLNAFKNKAAVICNKEESDSNALKIVENLYNHLGMHMVYMTAQEHDVHTAYISHVSHITSFALANTVLEKEKEDTTIFELASGGFESTVRLAKSHAAMWTPIFMQNKENVLDVLNEHITQLKKFKSCLEKENFEYLNDLIVHANTIKRIIK